MATSELGLYSDPSIQENPSYKAVNKDLWTMVGVDIRNKLTGGLRCFNAQTLEFCSTLEERTLADWNDDEVGSHSSLSLHDLMSSYPQSWPSLLDEFVGWEKKRRAAAGLDSQGDVDMG